MLPPFALLGMRIRESQVEGGSGSHGQGRGRAECGRGPIIPMQLLLGLRLACALGTSGSCSRLEAEGRWEQRLCLARISLPGRPFRSSRWRQEDRSGPAGGGRCGAGAGKRKRAAWGAAGDDGRLGWRRAAARGSEAEVAAVMRGSGSGLGLFLLQLFSLRAAGSGWTSGRAGECPPGPAGSFARRRGAWSPQPRAGGRGRAGGAPRWPLGARLGGARATEPVGCGPGRPGAPPEAAPSGLAAASLAARCKGGPGRRGGAPLCVGWGPSAALAGFGPALAPACGWAVRRDPSTARSAGRAVKSRRRRGGVNLCVCRG